MPMYPPEMGQPPPGPNGAMSGAPMGAQGPAVGSIQQLGQQGQQGGAPRQDLMSMANQVYVLQQQLTVVMQEVATMRQRRRRLQYFINRDQDGRAASLTVMEDEGE